MKASHRSIAHIHPGFPAEPAPGLSVMRPLPGPLVEQVSPFLMIDHFGPLAVAPGERGGLNPHPHRGFETVTLLFDGAMEHQDSLGNRGTLRAGGVQWMTAARGIVHAEYRETEFARTGGTLHGIQLWVNLPARHKMDAPGYQDLPAGRIPSHAVEGGALRVIAGDLGGTVGPARTHTPMLVAHGALAPRGVADVPLPAGWNALVYAISGRGRVNGAALGTHQMAELRRDGERVVVLAEDDFQFLLLAGAPIAEPVVSWGPFVMNTPEEIIQARKDYFAGRMGAIAP